MEPFNRRNISQEFLKAVMHGLIATRSHKSKLTPLPRREEWMTMAKVLWTSRTIEVKIGGHHRTIENPHYEGANVDKIIDNMKAWGWK